jgi:single-strand DNA-binding protein
VQKLILIGNAGADAELRYTPDGTPVASFSIADNRRWKNGDTIAIQTTWFRVAAWGTLAESARGIRKGDKLYIEGELMADPKTGGPRVWAGKSGPNASFEVRATSVLVLVRSARNQDAAVETAAEDEIPY